MSSFQNVHQFNAHVSSLCFQDRQYIDYYLQYIGQPSGSNIPREIESQASHALENDVGLRLFTPLKIYNGTTFGRLVRDSMATLAINQLGFRNAKPIGHKGIRRIPESPQLKGNPPKEDCPIQQVYEMFIGAIWPPWESHLCETKRSDPRCATNSGRADPNPEATDRP